MMATDAKCLDCAGCGRVATDDERTPWVHWENLPPGADLAVRLGIVRPVTCGACGGSGVVEVPDAPRR